MPVLHASQGSQINYVSLQIFGAYLFSAIFGLVMFGRKFVFQCPLWQCMQVAAVQAENVMRPKCVLARGGRTFDATVGPLLLGIPCFGFSTINKRILLLEVLCGRNVFKPWEDEL